MLTAVVVEDDPLSQIALRDLLSDVDDSIRIIKVYSTVAEALAGIGSLQVDLLFLDMELPDGKGFQVLEGLNEINFEVVIITNYDGFMLEAIKHTAMDYIMKPLTREGLTEAIRRFHKRREKFTKLQAPPDQGGRLVIPSQEGLTLVQISDIIRLESDGAYSYIFQADGTKFMASKNIGYFESKLAHHGFIRVHHSHLVNVGKVKHYSRNDGGFLTLSDNTQVAVSRRKKEDVLRALGG